MLLWILPFPILRGHLRTCRSHPAAPFQQAGPPLSHSPAQAGSSADPWSTLGPSPEFPCLLSGLCLSEGAGPRTPDRTHIPPEPRFCSKDECILGGRARCGVVGGKRSGLTAARSIGTGPPGRPPGARPGARPGSERWLVGLGSSDPSAVRSVISTSLCFRTRLYPSSLVHPPHSYMRTREPNFYIDTLTGAQD